MDHTNPPDRLLRLSAVTARTGLNRSSLYDVLAKDPTFPRPVKIGRISAWSERELSAWIEARKAERGTAA